MEWTVPFPTSSQNTTSRDTAGSPPPSPQRLKRERLSISVSYAKKRRENSLPKAPEGVDEVDKPGQSIKMLDGSRIDVSNIPKEYLEAYPYPAFVLVSPIPPSPEDAEDDAPMEAHIPFTRSTHSRIHPFNAIWSNEKWRNLTRGMELLECVSVAEARRLGDWISGARAMKAQDSKPVSTRRTVQEVSEEMEKSLARTTISPRTSVDHGYPPPPEGFWEPEKPPYEDKSSKSDGTSEWETGTGIEGPGGEHPGPATITVTLSKPGRVSLQMTKSSLPIWQFDRNDGRNRLATHTFVVITTVPRSSFIPNAAHPDPTPKLSGTDMHKSTSAMDLGSPLHSPSDPNLLVPPFPHEKPRMTVLPGQSSPGRIPANLGIAPESSPSTADLTPTEEIMALDLPPAFSTQSIPANQPLFFNRDGTVSGKGTGRKGKDSRGKSLDVHELLQTTDWSKTALGPRSEWPQSLRTIVSLIMQYPHQCCLWWGKDLTLIYNEPYAETIHKHPDLFAMSGPIAWAEIWSSIGPLSELVLNGTPVYKEDDFLLFKQLPHQGTGTFEAYHTWMWVPVIQEDGTVGGLWNATIDNTAKVLAERRLATVREMGERTSIARTLKEYDSAVIDILGANTKDIPFALLYHVDVQPIDRKDTSAEAPKKAVLTLAADIGVPDDHPSKLPKMSVPLSQKKEGRASTVGPFSHGILGSPTMSIVSSLSNTMSTQSGSAPHRVETPDVSDLSDTIHEHWPLREALHSRRLVLIEDCSALIEGYPIRIWDELPNAAVVVPIANDSDEGVPTAVAVIGLSIRRPFDDDYESFIHVLRLQLASGLAAVRSYEVERQRIEDLAALDRAKSMLFSNVSHELRTPLTLVAGPLDDMLAETKEGPRRETLLMARRNVRRLTRLVSTLMDVSRLEAGRLKGSFRQVNIGIMTRDLAGLFRGAIERTRLKYVVESDLTPRNVFVDPEHWEKIMFNLIGNALKYTMKGFVHVSLSYTKSDVVLVVKDSGVGIPHSDIGLVGERFHRVESVSRSYEGTGIGLALVKELIKLHGGTLEIKSQTVNESADGSHGSAFTVRIPLGSDHLPPDAIEAPINGHTAQTTYGQGIVDEAMQWNKDREGSSADSSSDSGGVESVSSRGLDPTTLYFKKEDVIMLVDDSFDVRRYMRTIFLPYCKVVEARNGQEALDLCAQSMPDLIISDVMMPVLDGFAMLASLKSSSKFNVIPVIMLTAKGGDEAKVEGLLAGAEDYLGKPFNSSELIARAHMQLQLGKKRRFLETAFDERTAEMRALTEYSPGGIFRCDEYGNVTFTNSAWHEISGYPESEETITNWGDYIDPIHRRHVSDFWESVYNSDSPPLRSCEWRFVNGRWVTAKIIRLDKASSGLKGILGCVTDITERKLHEEAQRDRMLEAEQRRIEAEEAKRQQELLIDITSHEIRNPISSLMQIKYCSSLVKTNLLSLKEQLEMSIKRNTGFMPTEQLFTTINEDLEALESIYQCGLTQERISNDVLSLGRIQLDMLQMFDVETDVLAEAQKVISIFQNEARMKRIALSLNIGESIERIGLHHIKTDPVRLGQVVTNLLSNGIRFTSNSMTRKIELRFDLSFEPPADGTCLIPRLPDRPSAITDDMPIYLYVAVTDTGPGLTPKELELLFQRFSQVSPKTHTIFGGSGLGLFVCRKITEIMGGRIEVASQHGHGSTFRFFIQARTAHTAKRPAGSTPLNRSPSKKKQTDVKRGLTGPKPHVLIVEDNLINQTVLKRQLKHVGLTCEVASNGLEALERVRQVSSKTGPRQGHMFDCILMDLEMPVMDGLTALRHIREEEADGKLSFNLVIALTGNARQGQIDEAKAAGMDEVVIKPYRLDDLLVKIEDMMKVRALRAVEGDFAE